jgi:hypothetical protein
MKLSRIRRRALLGAPVLIAAATLVAKPAAARAAAVPPAPECLADLMVRS